LAELGLGIYSWNWGFVFNCGFEINCCHQLLTLIFEDLFVDYG